MREVLGERQYAKDTVHVLAVNLGLLLYADDLLVCATSAAAATRVVAAVADYCATVHLNINADKCAVLPVHTLDTAVFLGST